MKKVAQEYYCEGQLLLTIDSFPTTHNLIVNVQPWENVFVRETNIFYGNASARAKQ